MNTLDSPLEVLAINYLSFGFLTAVNNVWAWIAVITTAAVSVWRIRSSSPPRPPSKIIDESSLLTCYSSTAAGVERLIAAEPTSTSANIPSKPLPSPSMLSSSDVFFQREGRTSGKFTVHFQEEDECGNDGDGDHDERDVNLGGRWNDVVEGKEWLSESSSLEVTMKMRMGDMGWYRYQDLTVLDGNVVRLWDGCRREKCRPVHIVWR